MKNSKNIFEKISIYVHLPWCVKKCPYCDFNSHQAQETSNFSTYTDSLIKDLKNQLKYIQERKVQSIFFGGGTPSLFPSQSIKRLLINLKDNLDFLPDIEITLEANPGTMDEQKFADYIDAGVNRLSIGVQSFNNQSLELLGRIHNSDLAQQSIETAKYVGFKKINIDLMYGLPQQSIEMALQDVKIALNNEVEHISYYQLTLEPNTSFFKSPPDKIPKDDNLWHIQENAYQLLQQEYHNYEISAWSKIGYSNQCLHNLNYWRFGDYIGLGAGSHGKISQWQDEELKIYRTKHRQSPMSYMLKPTELLLKNIPFEDRLFEYMLNQLRLQESFQLKDCLQLTDLNEKQILSPIKTAVEQGYLAINNNNNNPTISKTQLGKNFLNNCQQLFL